MKNLIGKKVLITCSAWFYAPDGIQYRGVWGTLKSVQEASKVFGFTPNRAHANWFLEIGDMVITGCQVNYLIECQTAPNFEIVPHQLYDHEHGGRIIQRMNEIYITE